MVVERTQQPQQQTPEQKKVRELHNCNTDIYDLMDRIVAIGEDVGLAYSQLRDAAGNIQNTIGKLLTKMTENPNTDGKD